MFFKIHARLRRLKRFFSKYTIIARIYPSKDDGRDGSSGLIMVQIDGLSRNQMTKALQSSKLPFLSRLLKHEQYRLYSHYSGLPSTTPAVQAELFYGKKTAVPSFGFKDHTSGKKTSMFNTFTAEKIEQNLKSGTIALLKNGSSYSNIYTGGASKASYCMTHLGLTDSLVRFRSLYYVLFFVLHGLAFMRTLALLIFETFLAFFDMFRGIGDHKNFSKELKFIPSRVGLCILLRELITSSCILDIKQGKKIIHLNFLGYDEQAHRRGPSSGFAHWTLKGIDDCIKRIWNTAAQSNKRDYDIWIYSDHGQETVTPYQTRYGLPIEKAVINTFHMNGFPHWHISGTLQSIQLRRIILLGSRFSKNAASDITELKQNSEVIITGIGPFNHLYIPEKLSVNKKKILAKSLVEHTRIPLVMMVAGNRNVWAYTPRGNFILPDNAGEVFGFNHPFLEEIKKDILRVVYHPDAGDFVLSGWSSSEPPLTFPLENGSHAGPGSEETHGFALLPPDIAPKVLPKEKPYFRPEDLRNAALLFINKSYSTPQKIVTPTIGRQGRRRSYRIMTYNIHSCINFDQRHIPQRIARIIALYQPDIVALQEVDKGHDRSECLHQAAHIAAQLDMEYHFHPCFTVEECHYGIAVMSRFPMHLVHADIISDHTSREPRGVIWVQVECGDTLLQVFNTHLGLTSTERKIQVQNLLSDTWLSHPRCRTPSVLCGDFNFLPGSSQWRTITSMLSDSISRVSSQGAFKTWMGITRLDYIFVSKDIGVRSVYVPQTQLIRTASDHYPFIADIILD